MKHTVLSFLAGALFLGMNIHAQDALFTSGRTNVPLLEEKAGNYGEFCGYQLNGKTTTDNSNDGFMFTVKAKENVYISGFSVFSSNSGGYARIYKKNGSYNGYQANPSSWNLIDSAFVSVSAPNLTTLNMHVDTYISAGNQVSFYVTGTGSVQFNYLNGTTEGAVLSENADLITYEGIGIQFPFGTSFTPRDFAGKIHYCKATQFQCDTSVTQYNSDNGNFGVFFNVASKSKEIYLDNIFTDFSGSGLGSVKIYTKTGTFQGSESNAAAWTLLDSAQIVNPANNSPEAVSSGFSLTIPANSVQGFHIVSNSSTLGLNYTNGSTSGDTIRNEAFMAITGGLGADAAFTSNGLPRKINGTVSYCVNTTSVTENLAEEIRIYPNPATDIIYIDSKEQHIYQLQLIDISGKVLYQTQTQQNQLLSIDMSQYPAGTYFVKLRTDSQSITKTIIK